MARIAVRTMYLQHEYLLADSRKESSLAFLYPDGEKRKQRERRLP